MGGCSSPKMYRCWGLYPLISLRPTLKKWAGAHTQLHVCLLREVYQRSSFTLNVQLCAHAWLHPLFISELCVYVLHLHDLLCSQNNQFSAPPIKNILLSHWLVKMRGGNNPLQCLTYMYFVYTCIFGHHP